MEKIGNDNPGLPGDGSGRFSELMEQVRLGSHQAAEELWRQYGPYVVHVVRRSLHHRLRARFDSQDFAQAAWASFFAELPRAAQLDTPAALVGFLSRIARNKVIVEHRRLHGPERNVKRQRQLRSSAADRRYVDPKLPTPSQQAAAEDMVEQVTADQPPLYGRVVQMRLDGMGTVEIARQENTTTRTVRRVLAHVKQLFVRRLRDHRE
ncbi:MAG TPA: sigma-70 family RNA polymerase sigma factor [Pirellulales bacterium]|nr:sigma-70 family RNA polymerase sigma factor [Pirellulales bacterium]